MGKQWKMQIKIIMGYHFIPIKTGIIKNKTKQKIISASKDMKKLDPVHCWWECKMVQQPWEMVWQFAKN